MGLYQYIRSEVLHVGGGEGMREIKVRSWDTELKQYVYRFNYNDYEISDDDGSIYITKNIETSGETPLLELEQFTGLHDKTGKEIYEGDIIVLGTNKPCVVNYDSKRACFSADIIGRGNTCFHTDFWSKGEVIGNIHENPELLK